MISIAITRGADGDIRAFTARNHGASDVCAAVSLLVINTVNSIEALTDTAFSCDYKDDGGFIRFSLTDAPAREAGLLLDAMLLGLRSVAEQYADEIKLDIISEIENERK